MKTTADEAFQVPVTISGLWALHPLIPIADESAYEAASSVCARLAVRSLNVVQQEYFRELTALVEEYGDQHQLLDKTESGLRQLASKQ